MKLNELIKELDKKLEVTKEEIIGGTMYIYCETKRQNTKCKYCSKESQSVHSTYTRTIADLPIQNYKVKLIITVKNISAIMINVIIEHLQERLNS